MEKHVSEQQHMETLPNIVTNTKNNMLHFQRFRDIATLTI